MNWRFYIAIGCLILVFGCKTNRQIIIEGIITESYTGIPLEGVAVEASFSELSFGSVSSGFELASQTFSGSEGRYRLVFEEPSTSQYRIRATRSGLIQEEALVEAIDFTTEEPNLIDITMFFDAGLELIFTQGNNPNSTALFQLGPHSAGCLSCCPSEQSYFISGGDTTISCSIYGNQTIDYELNKLTGGSSTLSRGSIDVTDQKVTLELTY